MTTEQDIQRSEPKGSTQVVPPRVPYRAIIGTVIGGALGALAGYLIDAKLTDEPFAGARIGVFLGGLLGGQIGGGNGLTGIAVSLTMVVCSAIGVVVPMVACWIWRPLPMDHWVLVVVSLVGGVVGALIGVTVSVIAFDPRRTARRSRDGEA